MAEATTELLMGRLALRRRWIQPQRLVEGLLLQTASGFKRPLVDILVEKGGLGAANAAQLPGLAGPGRKPEDDEEPELAPDPGPDPRLGRIIAQVRLDARLERKAFWVTFAGRRPNDPEPVTLKLIDSAALRSGLWMDFLETVRACVAVKSPNVVPVLEVVRVEGAFGIVSRFLEGFSLASLLAKVRRIRLSEALRIAKEAAKGLRDLHKAGIVHRNLTPGTVWLAKKGPPCVQDAGLAVEPPGARKMAERGVMFGSPWYMSPEAARGDVLDARSDVYALGAILYEMATGTRPFEGFGIQDLLNQHLNAAPVPPDAHLPDIPKPVTQLLLATLAKKKEDRPGDDDLVRALEKLEAEAPKPPPSKKLDPPKT